MDYKKIIKEELEVLKLLKEFNKTINEGFSDKDFGSNAKMSDVSVTIPKENSNIKSPTSGTIQSPSYKMGCTNQIRIEFNSNNSKYYLEYCGITTPKISKGSSVSKGTILGTTTDDVKVNLYDSKGNKFYFSNLDKTIPSKTTTSKTETGTRIDDRYKKFQTKELGKVVYDNRYKKWNQ